LFYVNIAISTAEIIEHWTRWEDDYIQWTGNNVEMVMAYL